MNHHHSGGGHHMHHPEPGAAALEPQPEPETAAGMMHHSGHVAGHMQMFFHGGYSEVILFDFWRIDSLGGLVGSMLACFVLGILYEAVKFGRDHVLRTTAGFKAVKQTDHNSSSGNGNTTDTSLAIEGGGGDADGSKTIDAAAADESLSSNTQVAEVSVVKSSVKIVETEMLSCGHLMLTALHFLQLTLAYFLMLIVMTYNTWLCLAVVSGATVGYFLFGWRKNAIIDGGGDHCH